MAGRMCGRRATGYAKAQPEELCQRCGSVAVEFMLASTEVMFVSLYVTVLTTMTAFKNPRGMKHVGSIILKQFSNYMHIVIIVLPVTEMQFRTSGLRIQSFFE